MPPAETIFAQPFTNRCNMAKHLIKITAHSVRRGARAALWTSRLLLKLLPPGVEIFLHRHFGERYFPRMAGSFFLFLAYRHCVLLIPYFSSRPAERFFLGFYALCFFVVGVFHFAEFLIRRFRLGDEIHSFSCGKPFSFWQRLGTRPIVVQRRVEPALCFCAFLVVSMFAPALGSWILYSACAALFKIHIDRWTLRTRMLDTIDARIEAQQLNERIRQRTAPRHHAAGRFFDVSPVQPPPGRWSDL